MTFPSLPRRISARAALGTALAAAVLGCTAIAETGSTRTPGATDTPIACVLDVTPSGGTLVIEGLVEARQPVSGNYHLRVSRAGSLMNQGGAFALGPGETATLGRVMMNGPASGLDAELTLTVDGDSFACPVDL